MLPQKTTKSSALVFPKQPEDSLPTLVVMSVFVVHVPLEPELKVYSSFFVERPLGFAPVTDAPLPDETQEPPAI